MRTRAVCAQTRRENSPKNFHTTTRQQHQTWTHRWGLVKRKAHDPRTWQTDNTSGTTRLCTILQTKQTTEQKSFLTNKKRLKQLKQIDSSWFVFSKIGSFKHTRHRQVPLSSTPWLCGKQFLFNVSVFFFMIDSNIGRQNTTRGAIRRLQHRRCESRRESILRRPWIFRGRPSNWRLATNSST